ncbi:MAG: hypothetical protein EZS28_046928, partial [Streblomastix strix]
KSCLKSYWQHHGNVIILFCSIAPPLHYETAILGRRDWILPRAVHPYGFAIQQQRKQEQTQIRTIPDMLISFISWARYKNTYIGLQFELYNRFASRTTEITYISVRSTVRSHCCYQFTNATHHTAIIRLMIVNANIVRHYRSAAAGN